MDATINEDGIVYYNILLENQVAIGTRNRLFLFD
jgi:hypothetical protein